MIKKSLLLMLLMVLLAPWAANAQSLFSEDFESGSMPTGWTTDGSGTWSVGTGDYSSSTGAGHGTYNAKITHGTTGNVTKLITPEIDLSSTISAELSFMHVQRSWSGDIDELRVYYRTSSSGSWTLLEGQTYTSAVASWTTEEGIILPNLSSTYQIAFEYTDNYGYGVGIDYVNIVQGASCVKPSGLAATNLTTESATLGWTAPDPAPSNGYNVRYRTALIDNPYYFDDFETNTLTGWTIYTDGEAGQTNGWYTINPQNGLSFAAHSGSYCASAWSWNNQAYDADNWLISPQVPLTGTLRFYVRTNASYPDEYEVLLSSTGTDEADFDVTLQAMAAAPATGAWAEVSISLKSYSGNGYIAIHHVSNDCNYLLIDDFGIFDEPTPAGAWVNKTTSTNSLNISGLTEETTYDFEVQSNCGGGETSDWVASTFTTNPSCMPVANLAVSDATTTTISLTWTDQNSGSASYIITDGDDNPVTVTNLTITGCTVTGLTANTLYTFKVTADCGSTAETIQARTDCDALATLPYEEGFEASSVNIYCWDLDDFARLNNSTYSHTGSFSLYSQTSSVGYAILPATATNISDLMLNFWWQNYYSGYDLGSLEVGYLTDEADYTTFVTVGTIDMSSSSDTYTQTIDYVFTGAPAGARIALKYTTGTDGSLVLIDDLTLDVAPSCMKPTDLAINGGLQAVVSWTGTADSFDIAFSDDPTVDPKTVIVGNSTTNSFNLYEVVTLTEGDYTVWVRGNCGTNGYSDWVSTSFHLGYCTPNPTSHDGKGITAVSFGTGSYVVNNGDGSASIPASSPYYGDYSSMIGAIPAGVPSTIAITTGTGSYPYTFVIWVDLDNDFTFEDEEVLYVGKAASGNGTLNAEITIPGTQTLGDYRMRIYGADSYFTSFYGNGTTNWSAAHDPCSSGTYRHAHDYTLRVLEAPSCLAPTGLYADNITTNSADLSWTANSGETSWNIFYKKTSETEYTELKKVTDNPYQLTGLDAATDYEYYVVANCSSTETSDPSAVYYFTTECGAITITAATKYTQNFESPVVNSTYSSTTGLEVPVCWENPYTTGSSAAGQPHLVKAGASYNYSTGQVLLFYGSGYNYVTLPEFTNALNELQITFKWATESNSNGTLTLGYITDGDVNYNTFTEIAGASYPASSSSYHTMLQADPVYLNTLPATAKRLVFRWYYSGQYSCNVDDVEVSLMPSCYPLGTLTYDNLASQTVDLHWTLVDATQDAWQVCLNNDETNLVDITATDVTISGNAVTYSLSGLTAETAYTVKVRANCGGSDFSDWSNIVSFTTLTACATPTGLAASNLTQNGANLAWTGSSDVAAYTVQYRTAAGLQTHYFEGFESGIGDWTMVSCASSTGISTGSSYAHTGNAAFKFSYNTNPPQYLVSPAISGITSGMQLEFWYKNGSTSWPETFQVGFSSTDNDVASFAFEDEISASDAQWHSYSVAVPASTKYLCFKLNSNDKMSLYIDDITIGAVVAAGSWQTAANDVTAWNYELAGLTASVKYDARVYANCETNPDANNAMTTFTTLADGNIVFPDDGNWIAGNFEPTGAPTITDNVIIRADVTVTSGTNAYANNIALENSSVITVANGATLTLAGNVTGGTSASIIVEQGGQLIHSNAVNATLQINVTGYSSKTDNAGYRLIASPINSSYYSPSSAGLTTGTYDLYSFDQSQDLEWRNYEAGAFSYLTLCKGYLYANASGVNGAFAGSTVKTNEDRVYNLTYTTGAELAGWNLVGNPFTCNAYVKVYNGTETNYAPYYVLNTTGDALNATAVAAGTPVVPMQGLFVQATATGQSCIFTTTAPLKNSNLNLNVSQNSAMVDNAIISFRDGSTLEKLSFNEGSTKVYIPVDGKDYAVVSAEEQGEMPVCFKAEENGTYTMSFTSENTKFSYLHLIDNMTGADVDLLVNPNYTFNARYTDYASRFKLVFVTGNNDSESNFGFISDGNLMILGIEGEATLQMIDVTGRILSTETFSGSYNKALNASAGVYMLRLIQGENVRTQKIVVK